MSSRYDSPALRTIFASLIRKAGGGPSVIVAVEELTGRKMSVGTLSKISNGDMRMDWEVAFILEDIVEEFPFQEYLNARRDQTISQSDQHRLALAALKEIGEVPAAVLHFITTGESTLLEKEGAEGSAAIQALLDYVKGRAA
jgi:hypothetical protein